MSRLVYSVAFAFCSVLSISAVGCGGGGNEVIEDTRPLADIEQEEDDYEKMMEETADEVTE